MLTTIKKQKSPLPSSVPNEREISAISQKIAKDWFDAAIKRNTPQPSLSPREEKESAPEYPNNEEQETKNR